MFSRQGLLFWIFAPEYFNEMEHLLSFHCTELMIYLKSRQHHDYNLLSQKVRQPSDARARQIPSESSSNFKLLLESEESRLL